MCAEERDREHAQGDAVIWIRLTIKLLLLVAGVLSGVGVWMTTRTVQQEVQLHADAFALSDIVTLEPGQTRFWTFTADRAIGYIFEVIPDNQAVDIWAGQITKAKTMSDEEHRAARSASLVAEPKIGRMFPFATDPGVTYGIWLLNPGSETSGRIRVRLSPTARQR